MLYQTIQHYGVSSGAERSHSTSNLIITASNTLISWPRWLSGIRQSILIGTLVFVGCNSEYPEEKSGAKSHPSQQEKENTTAKTVGKASWYGPGFQGQKTASGEKFNQKEMTAASPSLPIGTKAEVTNLDNGKKVDVKINDRGPYNENRKIDVSNAAAKKLDMKKSGTTKVKIEAKHTRKKSSPHKSSKAKKNH